MAETKKQCVEAAIRSMRYGAHPHRSPHADDLETFLKAGAFDEIAAPSDASDPGAAGPLAQAVPKTIEPPLAGRWHHGQGILVSGTIRIAQWDCDTNPPVKFRDDLLEWVCHTLNAAVDAWEANAPDELALDALGGV